MYKDIESWFKKEAEELKNLNEMTADIRDILSKRNAENGAHVGGVNHGNGANAAEEATCVAMDFESDKELDTLNQKCNEAEQVLLKELEKIPVPETTVVTGPSVAKASGEGDVRFKQPTFFRFPEMPAEHRPASPPASLEIVAVVEHEATGQRDHIAHKDFEMEDRGAEKQEVAVEKLAGDETKVQEEPKAQEVSFQTAQNLASTANYVPYLPSLPSWLGRYK